LGSYSVLDQLRQQKQFSKRLARLSDQELYALRFDWLIAARPNQIAPKWDWATWLVLAGRGYGKTRVGAESVRGWIGAGFNHVNMVAPTADDLRDVMVEGESGILAVCPRQERPIYRVSKRRLEWPNGARSLLFTAQEPDRLRGKQHSKLWTDEPASWQYDSDAWDQAQFGLRLGKNPQTVATTTPRPTALIRMLIAASRGDAPTVAITRGTTYENRSNLAPGFYSKIITRYENTRLGRQELLAEVLDDNPDALFHMEHIEGARVSNLPPLIRIVVAMDPATTSNPDSDEWGIIAAGQDGRDPAHFYILADESEVYSPDEAAKQAVRLYHRLGADRLVGEANNGGDMIEALIRHQDANISYKKVTASRGKVTRAEPVSALYEQHRVHHHGMFAKLEDQATNWNPAVDKDSPDRMDAMVWAMTELAEGSSGWAGFVKDEGQKSPEAPKAPRINVAGGDRDRCECGSVVWDGDKCFKCGKARPEA
jgi:phage terminase large subunit-like protein